LGIFLPYIPLHHLVFVDGSLSALAMTSANLSEEPIAIDNDEVIDRLCGIADFFLRHNRKILLRTRRHPAVACRPCLAHDDSEPCISEMGGIPHQPSWRWSRPITSASGADLSLPNSFASMDFIGRLNLSNPIHWIAH
jgi:hypothetical protein